jgi:hypothetical protein
LTFFVDNVVAGVAVEGDYNSNGVVDAADYTVWRDHLPDPNSPDPPSQNFGLSPAEGDGNGDGFVTLEDFEYWKSRFLASGVGAGEVVAALVPEPGSALLLTVAGVGCLVSARFRQVR